MALPFDFAQVLDDLSEVALDFDRWMRTWNRIIAITHSTGAVLIPFDVDSRLGGTLNTAEVTGLAESYLKADWYKHDLRARGIPKLLHCGVIVDQDVTNSDEMRASIFYNDFIYKCGLKWFAGLHVRAGSESWCLTLQRTAEQGPFLADEERQLASLCTPISNVATVAHRLNHARLEGIAQGLEMTETAAVMVNDTGRVIQTNRAADALLGKDLQIWAGRLTTADQANATALHNLIMSAVASPAGAGQVSSPLALKRPGRAPLTVQAVTLGTAALDIFSSVRAIVLIHAPVDSSGPQVDLKSQFGLTTAEVGIAMLVGTGALLSDAADELGMARETARSHLQSVFRKTGVHRQADLVRLFASLGLQPH